MKNRVFTMQDQDIPLAKELIGLAMKVHRTLGCGFSETVYRNALVIELRKAGVAFEVHQTLSVKYEGQEVGVFQADLIVNGKLIVELKAVESLCSAHSAQLVNYLKATGIDHGLLLNFGSTKLEFKTKSRDYPPPNLHS
jgi:GxxExxY protein